MLRSSGSVLENIKIVFHVVGKYLKSVTESDLAVWWRHFIETIGLKPATAIFILDLRFYEKIPFMNQDVC